MAEKRKENITTEQLLQYVGEKENEFCIDEPILSKTMASIESILRTIDIDLRGIQREIINESKVKGFSAVFRIFGIALIKESHDDPVAYKKAKTHLNFKQFIQLPEDRAKEAVQTICENIKQYVESQEGRISRLKVADEKKGQEIRNLREASEQKERQWDREREEQLEMIQKLCSGEAIRMNKELLNQLQQEYDIKVIYDISENNLNRYYTTLNAAKIGDGVWEVKEMQGYYMASPCLMQEGVVIKKGLVYRLVKDIES